MKAHFVQTISDLKARRAALDELIASLETFGAAGEARPLEPTAPIDSGTVARRKYTRRAVDLNGAKPPKDSPAQPSVASAPNHGFETLGAAMKDWISHGTVDFTILQLTEAMQKMYPELVAHMSNGAAACGQSVAYWASKGYLEKLGQGYSATYKMVDRDWFKKKVEA